MKLIAETAWHHEGDFAFMKNLVHTLAHETQADIIKMHITLDFDEYMDSSHPGYELLRPWLFSKEQWSELMQIVRDVDKELMLLLNDKEAIEFGISMKPEYVEVHSVCLNDLFLLRSLKSKMTSEIKLVLGVGGTDLYEIDHALNYFNHPNIILMFGFQNYPTVYKDVNLHKVKKIMQLYPHYEYGYADHTVWNSPHNELITLLGGALGMEYIEKHVTTLYGEERVDWSAAISVEMFNTLARKLKILEELNGDGTLQLNASEESYSVFGPMKKAAVLKRNVGKGEVFSEDMIKFTRTGSISDMSQVDVIKSFGKRISKDMLENEILMHDSLV